MDSFSKIVLVVLVFILILLLINNNKNKLNSNNTKDLKTKTFELPKDLIIYTGSYDYTNRLNVADNVNDSQGQRKWQSQDKY